MYQEAIAAEQSLQGAGQGDANLGWYGRAVVETGVGNWMIRREYKIGDTYGESDEPTVLPEF